jgi:hypothetical protein
MPGQISAGDEGSAREGTEPVLRRHRSAALPSRRARIPAAIRAQVALPVRREELGATCGAGP